MIFTVSYEAYLPNAINFSLVKIKQLRFAYLEDFIFYVSQRRKQAPKRMQLSLMFEIGFYFSGLVSDMPICG